MESENAFLTPQVRLPLLVPGPLALLESPGMNGDALLSSDRRRRKEHLSSYH